MANSNYVLDILVNAKDNASSVLDKVGGSAGGLNSALKGLAIGGGIALVAGALLAVGKAAIGVAEEVDAAQDAIIAGTGASGPALDEMTKAAVRLKGSTTGIGAELEDIGSVIAEVTIRTGESGPALEALTGQFLKLSRLTESDAVPSVQKITRVMGDWGVSNKDAAGLLDKLFVASQKSGAGVDDLAASVVQFGAPLRQMGFTLDESISLFAKWEKEGVNAELVMGSLRIASGHFAEEGVGLRDGLNATMEAIKGAATESEGLVIAMDVFGARAGPDMAAAIREGRFEIDEMLTAIQGAGGGLDDAAERTLDFKDKFAAAMERVKLSTAPAGDAILGLFDRALPSIESGANWLAERIPGAIDTVTAAFDAGGAGWGSILGNHQETIQGILDKAAAFWEQHGEGILDVLDNLKEIGGILFNQFIGNILDIVDVGLSLLTGDWEGAQAALERIWERTKESGERIFQLAIDSILTLIDGFVPGFKDRGQAIIDGLLDGLRSAWQGVLDWFSGLSWPSLPSLNFSGSADSHATGTVWSRGGLALVGERGPELVRLPRGAEVLTALRSREMAGSQAAAPSTPAGAMLRGLIERTTGTSITPGKSAAPSAGVERIIERASETVERAAAWVDGAGEMMMQQPGYALAGAGGGFSSSASYDQKRSFESADSYDQRRLSSASASYDQSRSSGDSFVINIYGAGNPTETARAVERGVLSAKRRMGL